MPAASLTKKNYTVYPPKQVPHKPVLTIHCSTSLLALLLASLGASILESSDQPRKVYFP